MAGLTFHERMSGPFVMGVTDPGEGASRGKQTQWRMILHARVSISDMAEFVAAPSSVARLSGELELPGVRRPIPFDGGTFRLFPQDEPALMTYELKFTHRGADYQLSGRKCARTLPLRVWSDTTTLHTKLHRGPDVVGAGVLHIAARDFPGVLASMRPVEAASPVDAGAAIAAYAWLFARKLGRAYLPAKQVLAG